MNKSMVAAITVAINTYVDQEEAAKALPYRAMPLPEISAWRVFGRQESIRASSRWQARRHNR